VRPDGSEREVAFTLAFATPAAMPGLSFFCCQHHFPENFWSPELQTHENSALGVARVVIVHPRPLETLGFLKAFTGGEPETAQDSLDLALANAALSVLTPERARSEIADDPVFFGNEPRFAAIVYKVRSLDRARLALRANDVPHRIEKTRLVVPSGAAFGLLTAFEE
jgi:hypothetical protein